MATEYSSKKITELTNTNTAADGNLLAIGDSTTGELKKITLSNFATWIKSKLSSITLDFAAGTQTIESAINKILASAGTQEFYYWGCGVLTNAGKTIYFTTPTDKVLHGRQITDVVPVALSIRQNGNYLANIDVGGDFSNYTVGRGYGGGGVNLTVTKNDSAFPNAVNNDIVGVYFRYSITWA